MASLAAHVSRLLAMVPRRRSAPAASGPAFPLHAGEERVALVSMLGVEPAAIDAILRSTNRTLVAFDRIVFVTDSADFRPFRAGRATFEYLPPLADMMRHAPDLPWPAYLGERRALIVAKWRPEIEVTYGTSFADYIARCGEGREAQ